MKKRTRVIVRVIGGILFILSLIAGYFSLKDTVFNGLDLATIFLFVGGTYLMVASPESLRSWLPWKKEAHIPKFGECASFLYNRKFLRNSYYIKMLQSLLPLRFHRFALKLKSARTKGDYVSLFLFHNYIIYFIFNIYFFNNILSF